jgi:D-glycero-alpha-D-manno-heptose-7-phosphate kinase
VIDASAPVRICDIGGWTDTWFGGPGRVVNIAAGPGVRVAITSAGGPDPVQLDLRDFGARYPITPGAARVPRFPLVEAAIDGYAAGLDTPVEVTVSSAVPPGSGTGTSAAVAVAAVGALAAATGRTLSPTQVAHAAHQLEVDVLGAESGIQDQLCAALGGISHLSIEAYPDTTVERLDAWTDLAPLLTVIYLGRAHRSSDVHRQVIERVLSGQRGPLEELRTAAAAARGAVLAKDIGALGRAMVDNTAAQVALHPALVGADAVAVIDAARECGAIGWKVNGAGGDGGSITLLSATPAAKTDLDSAVTALDPRFGVLALTPSTDGLVVRGAI